MTPKQEFDLRNAIDRIFAKQKVKSAYVAQGRVIDMIIEQVKVISVDESVKCTCLSDCHNCGAKSIQRICSGSEVCPECFC